jgi:hypothetical protein
MTPEEAQAFDAKHPIGMKIVDDVPDVNEDEKRSEPEVSEFLARKVDDEGVPLQ